MPLKASLKDAKRYAANTAAPTAPTAPRRRDARADLARPVPGMNGVRERVMKRVIEAMEREPQKPLTPYWLFGGTPMCETCIQKAQQEEAPEDQEIFGGYAIETDKLPLCPGCGAELDLKVIG